MHRLRLVVVTLLLLPASLPAQERRLDWPAITIDANLDGEGRLHVREEQRIAFTGDWNGAQRRFRLPLGQRLDLRSLVRVDEDGTVHPLVRGDLSRVDQFDWVEGRTLRWRSRLPTDPPFDSTELVYVLEYTYDNVLRPQGGDGYLLDHEFAFTDREGRIETFTLRLELDPVWSAPPTFTGSFTEAPLLPGRGYVVRLPLHYLAPGRPAGIDFGAGPVPRYALAVILVAVAVGFAGRLYRRERALGRFSPLVPLLSIDEAWLAEHVFALRPEVVGAAWDDSTSAPEVAAVLARLVGEGKLKSWVETRRMLFMRDHVLHLELLVERDAFDDYERPLIDALFDQGSTVTSTKRVRERYKHSGFDPASKIRAPLRNAVRALGRGDRAPAKPRWAPTAVILVVGVALMIVGTIRRPADAPLLGATLISGVVLYIVAVIGAVLWRKRVHTLWSNSLRFLIPLGLLVGALLLVLVLGNPVAGPIFLGGATAFVLALVNSALNAAAARQSATMIARRRELASAREFFAAELARPQPRLRDEWFPYLIAFGLGPQMDRWFRAFGGDTASAVHSHAAFASGRSSGGSSGGWTGFGGGGGFSGGGASSAWISAAGTMASGVSAPSSSSSGGGGGGGGGSSGGGGGGGW